MVLALVLILVAVALFGVSFALKLAWWVLLIALALLVVGAISGYRSRRQL